MFPASRVVWVCLENQSAEGYFPRCVLNDHPGGSVYKLEFLSPQDAQGRDDAFKTYWIPYHENSLGTLTLLGNDAEYMFTARMSGCSLGLGSYAGDGVVGAAHVNAKNAGVSDPGSLVEKMEQQKKVQHAFLYSHGKNNPSLRLTQRIVTYDMYMINAFWRPCHQSTLETVFPSISRPRHERHTCRSENTGFRLIHIQN